MEQERINRITVLHNRRLARTDAGRSYFIGPVGDPVNPWLRRVRRDHGVNIVLPTDLTDVLVFLADDKQPENERGYYPLVAQPLSFLGADDLRMTP